MHVVLVGLRGVGKSTVGPLLAQRLGRPFWDLDDLVVRRLGATNVRAVFTTSGEAAWRSGESSAVDALFDAPLAPAVIALGGGAPLVPAVMRRLENARARRSAVVVHLTCDLDAIARRLQAAQGDRTSLTGRGVVEELDELSRLRLPVYSRLADVTVSAAGEPMEAVERVASALRI